MPDKTKKKPRGWRRSPLVAVIAVAVMGGAAYWIYRQTREAAIDWSAFRGYGETREGMARRLPSDLVCEACDARSRAVVKGRGPFACGACGKETAYRAFRCGECAHVYAHKPGQAAGGTRPDTPVAMPPDLYDGGAGVAPRCPECQSSQFELVTPVRDIRKNEN